MLQIYHIHLFQLKMAAQLWIVDNPTDPNVPFIKEALKAANDALYPQSKEEPDVK